MTVVFIALIGQTAASVGGALIRYNNLKKNQQCFVTTVVPMPFNNR